MNLENSEVISMIPSENSSNSKRRMNYLQLALQVFENII